MLSPRKKGVSRAAPLVEATRLERAICHIKKLFADDGQQRRHGARQVPWPFSTAVESPCSDGVWRKGSNYERAELAHTPGEVSTPEKNVSLYGEGVGAFMK